MLLHCNGKTASEFALWGPGVLLVLLPPREGALWWQNWLPQKQKASHSVELLDCNPLFLCFWSLSSKRGMTSTSAFIIWVCISLRKWQGWRVYVLSECQDDKLCSGKGQNSQQRAAKGRERTNETKGKMVFKLTLPYRNPIHDFPMKTFVHPKVLVLLKIPITG